MRILTYTQAARLIRLAAEQHQSDADQIMRRMLTEVVPVGTVGITIWECIPVACQPQVQTLVSLEHNYLVLVDDRPMISFERLHQAAWFADKIIQMSPNSHEVVCFDRRSSKNAFRWINCSNERLGAWRGR